MVFFLDILFEVFLPYILEWLFWGWLDSRRDERQHTVSEEFKKAVGITVLSGILGGVLGALSTIVSSRYWIQDESLQTFFLFVTPLVAGTLLWGWVRFKRREIWQGQAFAFVIGAVFLFGYLLARLTMCQWP